jgi:acetyltransferase-like isoleucine patch superfamily enzyme
MTPLSDPTPAAADRDGAHPGKIREILKSGEASAFERYRALTFPAGSVLKFWLFELATMLLLPFPGGLGIVLRRKLMRPFFGSMGRNVIIGRNCVFRNPHQIFIGDGVVIDENALLDARGTGPEGLRLAAGVLVSRAVQIKSKGGSISLGQDVTIGDGSTVISQTGIFIGDGVAVAHACHIAGGTFAMHEFSKPAPQRKTTSNGPIQIGAGTWIATGVLVLDGVKIGANSIISAGSVVTRNVPDRAVVSGNPAKKVFEIR